MATIHRIEDGTSRRQARNRSDVGAAQPGQIILFPGVRYERWIENRPEFQPSTPHPKLRRRQNAAD